MHGTADRRIATTVVMGVAAVTLFLASAIHFGLVIALGEFVVADPFDNAAVPEAVIAVVLTAGAVALVAANARSVALGTTLFAIAGVLVGISVTLGGTRSGDVVYHVTLLLLLIVNVLLLGADLVPSLALGQRHAASLALRVITLANAAVFLTASAQNFGARIAIGPIDWYFPAPIAQAGAGEAFIGAVLLVAALAGRATVLRVAYALAVLGIAFGLLSARVVGPAREIHLLLVPLTLVGLGLLLAGRRTRTAAGRVAAPS